MTSGEDSDVMLDADSQVTPGDVAVAVDVLKRASTGGLDITAMPTDVRATLQALTGDCSGKLNKSDLMSVAYSFQKTESEKTMMRRLFLGAVVFIVMLLGGMLGMGILAAELAKEVRASDKGILVTTEGETLKIGSSDYTVQPDGTLTPYGGGFCAKGSCDEMPNALKVAAASVPSGLSSTLPDAAFKELKTITLTSSGKSLQVGIMGFQRMKVRTSKCGSIVHLSTPNGRLTLDDSDLFVDEAMRAYIVSGGLHHLLSGTASSGLGRRLSTSDGALVGFFNVLERADWKCESQPLETPAALKGRSAAFKASARVRTVYKPQSGGAYSRIFSGTSAGEASEVEALLLPGIVKEDGTLYQVWDEEIVHSGGLEAVLSHFPGLPYTRELRVKSPGATLEATLYGGRGFYCEVEQAGAPAAGEAVEAEAHLEFVGVVNVDGLLLRHFRLHLQDERNGSRRLNPMLYREPDDRRLGSKDSPDGNSSHALLLGMMISGMIPNVYDYYDVDTDPEGVREAGSPYRVIFHSTVPGSKAYLEKTYLQVGALPSALNVTGVLDLLDVRGFPTPCEPGADDNGGPVGGAFVDEMLAGAAEVGPAPGGLPRGPRGAPPLMLPWREQPEAIVFHYDHFLKDAEAEVSAGVASPEWLKLQEDAAWGFWRELLLHRRHKAGVDSLRGPAGDFWSEWNESLYSSAGNGSDSSAGGNATLDETNASEFGVREASEFYPPADRRLARTTFNFGTGGAHHTHLGTYRVPAPAPANGPNDPKADKGGQHAWGLNCIPGASGSECTVNYGFKWTEKVTGDQLGADVSMSWVFVPSLTNFKFKTLTFNADAFGKSLIWEEPPMSLKLTGSINLVFSETSTKPEACMKADVSLGGPKLWFLPQNETLLEQDFCAKWKGRDGKWSLTTIVLDTKFANGGVGLKLELKPVGGDYYKWKAKMTVTVSFPVGVPDYVMTILDLTHDFGSPEKRAPEPSPATARFSLLTEGSCGYHITTEQECSDAAAALGLMDTTAESVASVNPQHEPPYCHFDIQDGEVKFHPHTNTGACTFMDKCICLQPKAPAYVRHDDLYCHDYAYKGNYHYRWNSLAKAQAVCNADPHCGGVSQWHCDDPNVGYNLCGSHIQPHGLSHGYYGTGTCTYEKQKVHSYVKYENKYCDSYAYKGNGMEKQPRTIWEAQSICSADPHCKAVAQWHCGDGWFNLCSAHGYGKRNYNAVHECVYEKMEAPWPSEPAAPYTTPTGPYWAGLHQHHSGTCPQEYVPVTTDRQCREASAALGYTYSPGDNDWETGAVCNWCWGCRPETTRMSPFYKSSWFARMICVQVGAYSDQ